MFPELIVKKPLSVFLADRRGAVAILTAIAMIPLLLVIGGGVDSMRVMAMRSDLQQAVDTAALAAMASQSDASQAGGAAAVAENYIHQNFLDRNVTVTTSVDTVNMTATVAASASVPTTLLGLIDIASIPISATATATMGASAGKPMEVALVFDVTASMGETITGDKIIKLDAAKEAATTLVKEITKTPGSPEKVNPRVRIGLAPFAASVVLDVERYRKEKWLTDTEDRTTTDQKCYWKYTYTKDRLKCEDGAYRAQTCYTDNMPFDCSYFEQICTGGTKTWQCNSFQKTHKWVGCLGVRNSPRDEIEGPTPSDSDIPASDKIPSTRDDYSCLWIDSQNYLTNSPNQLRRLSDYDVSNPANGQATFMKEINDLKYWGATYMPSGLLWGWNILSPLSPFADAKPYGEAIKIMILLSDGANTYYPSYPKIDITAAWNKDGSITGLGAENYQAYHEKANEKTLTLCSNIKAKGIRIYTIAFGLGASGEDTDGREVLEKCASSSDHYFNASNKDALDAAFALISKELTGLRLIK